MKKYSKKEIKIIQDFINTNIDNDIKVKTDIEYSCDMYEEIIYLGPKSFVCESFDNWFNQKFENGEKYNKRLIAILHEIGHIMTLNEETQDDREFRYALLLLQVDNISIDELNYQYYEITAELDATTWGYEFYKNNYELCQELVKELNL